MSNRVAEDVELAILAREILKSWVRGPREVGSRTKHKNALSTVIVFLHAQVHDIV